MSQSVLVGCKNAIQPKPHLKGTTGSNAASFTNCQGNARKKCLVNFNVVVVFADYSDFIFMHDTPHIQSMPRHGNQNCHQPSLASAGSFDPD